MRVTPAAPVILNWQCNGTQDYSWTFFFLGSKTAAEQCLKHSPPHCVAMFFTSTKSCKPDSQPRGIWGSRSLEFRLCVQDYIVTTTKNKRGLRSTILGQPPFQKQ
eukprot:1104183-Amphidinium_carterae.1